MMRVHLRPALAALAASLMFLPMIVAAPRAVADDTPVTESRIDVTGTPEAGGRPIALDASLFTTDPATPQPAIVLAHGFGGSKSDSAEIARSLARDGYTVITYTARGFGASGGLIHLDDPAYEGLDAQRVIDAAASRPEVIKNGTDPVIGFAGASYGGAAAFLAAGLDRRVDAIVPAFTWHSLSQALVPQYATRSAFGSAADVQPIATVGVFKQRWASIFFGSGAGGGADARSGACGRFSPELCRAFVSTAQRGEADATLGRLLDRSSLAPLLGKITAPTLIIHGEQDTLFPLDQADANYRGLPAATPKAMRWVTGGHDGGIDLDELLPELTGWFDRHLRQDPAAAADPGFSVAVPETSLIRRNAGARPPETYQSATYPRDAALPHARLPLTGDAQTLTSPPGGVPAALTSLPGTGSALGSLNGVAGYPLAVLPGQSAIFTTPVLTDPVRLVGSGEVDLNVTATGTEATLFVSLWDLGPDIQVSPGTSGAGGSVLPQTAILPQLVVSPVHLSGLTPGRASRVRVALPPVVHPVPVAHRLRVVVSATDQAYATPRTARTYQVALAGDPVLTLPQPVLTSAAGARIDLDLPLAVVVGLLVIAGIAALVVLWLRRRAVHPRAELAEVPLVVEDLVKTYAEGVLAVDGVSFRAEPGQVVGLLGPNGAGKTTALRMMVGLIRPDAGSVYIHGEPVHAGADVLSSVGALIEGPGFLPHLSGLDNLRTYWSATGRPSSEARLDEALRIAGLGEAIHRRVRGYSQGMRQRLGIAQAMLGLPSLLLLDEPTNGLDPPQIKAMRHVLADYAASGRTVVVSSHLLAEVELTCSHVVVMNRGRVVLTGSVPELTVTDAVTMIGLAPGSDLDSACRSIGTLGIEAHLVDDLIRVAGGTRSRIVERLVQDGFAIESVDGRRHLEDVFMGLLAGDPSPRVSVDA